jgi:ubiquinone/menaquinone biosynthesis C-methylase UbiE
MSDPTQEQLEERRRIRATYDAYARTGHERRWDHSNPGIARIGAESRAAVVDLLRLSLPSSDESRVLDLGCGDGSLAEDVKTAGIETLWTGLDLRPEAVEQARARYAWAEFVNASADALPFPDAVFDAVTAVVLFSSLPTERLERAVSDEIRRVLCPDGWLIWYDLRYNNPSNPDVHGMSRGRISELFPGWRQELRSTTLAPPIARRLGPLTPLLYSALSGIPMLRSHLIGRLQRPSEPRQP